MWTVRAADLMHFLHKATPPSTLSVPLILVWGGFLEELGGEERGHEFSELDGLNLSCADAQIGRVDHGRDANHLFIVDGEANHLNHEP